MTNFWLKSRNTALLSSGEKALNGFDLKRWGDTIERHTYEDGGNFITVLAVTINPNDNNKWTWRIPLKETDYNHAIGSNANLESEE